MGTALLALHDPGAASEFLIALKLEEEGTRSALVFDSLLMDEVLSGTRCCFLLPPPSCHSPSADLSLWLYLAEAATKQRDWDVARVCYETVSGAGN